MAATSMGCGRSEMWPDSTRARSRSSCDIRSTRSDSSWTTVAALVFSSSVSRLPSTSAWLKPIRLVRGVLSSWETLARNSRWVWRARSTASAMRLNA